MSVFLSQPIADLAPVTKRQVDTLRHLDIVGVPGAARTPTSEASFHTVLDGLIAYSLKGAPRGTTAQLFGWANRQPAPIIVLDVPSGVDASAGIVHDPAIRAHATLTLALPKTGMTVPQAKERMGDLYVADFDDHVLVRSSVRSLQCDI